MNFNQQLAEAGRHLSKNDARLAPIIKMSGPCRITPHTDHYGELVGSIVGQQLSVKAAATIWQRVLSMFGGKMPAPEQLIKISDQKLRDAGLSWAKVGYVKDLAQHILDKRLDLDHISTMPNDQLIEQLTAVKGIGEWSAHMFMMFGLGRLDILPVGDLGIRKAIMNLYELKQLPDPAAVVTIANENSWHPYESVAAWYLWQSLDNNPQKVSRHGA
ncbi:MAG: putative DNA-3-methyladenine glycosylase [Candidatus Saccharibacteria bacterium]|nr:putative DNA-3-methyladenine glycosylase [Candidatus Saccharibacteria bacterium]